MKINHGFYCSKSVVTMFFGVLINICITSFTTNTRLNYG